jgi:hypothetical protein
MFAMAFAVGANNIAKVVATLVSSGISSYKKAIKNITANPRATGAENDRARPRAISSPPGSTMHPH